MFLSCSNPWRKSLVLLSLNDFLTAVSETQYWVSHRTLGYIKFGFVLRVRVSVWAKRIKIKIVGSSFNSFGYAILASFWEILLRYLSSCNIGILKLFSYVTSSTSNQKLYVEFIPSSCIPPKGHEAIDSSKNLGSRINFNFFPTSS